MRFEREREGNRWIWPWKQRSRVSVPRSSSLIGNGRSETKEEVRMKEEKSGEEKQKEMRFYKESSGRSERKCKGAFIGFDWVNDLRVREGRGFIWAVGVKDGCMPVRIIGHQWTWVRPGSTKWFGQSACGVGLLLYLLKCTCTGWVYI